MANIFKKILQLLAKIPHDKLLHYILGLLLFEATFVLQNSLIGLQPGISAIISGVIVAGIAIWKEYRFDADNNGEVSTLDATSTILGGLTGAALMLL